MCSGQFVYRNYGPDSEFSNAPSQWQSPCSLSDDPTLQELKISLEYAHANIDTLREHVKANANVLKHQTRVIDKLQDAYTEILNYAADLEESILSLDTNSRKKNLIITGISEVPNENSITLILLILEP